MNIDGFRGNLSMLGGRSHRGRSGSGIPFAWRAQVGVLDAPEAAGGALDAEPEQVADAADVAAGGLDLAATARRNQARQWLSSSASIRGRPDRASVTGGDLVSSVDLRVASRRPPAGTPLSLPRGRDEPEWAQVG